MRLFVPLDVDFPDDPAVVALSLEAELLYLRALCLAKRTLTDGAIHPGHLRRLTDKMSTAPELLAGELVDAGLWTNAQVGWQIRSWLEHNRSADEITQELDRRRTAARERTRRWRERGTPDPDSVTRHRDVTVTSQQNVTVTSRDAPIDRDIDIDKENPPTPHTGDHAPGPDEGGGEPRRPGRFAARIDAAVDELLERERPPDRPTGPGWDVTVRRRILREHGPALEELAAANPDWTPHELATAAHSPRASLPAATGTYRPPPDLAAVQRAAERLVHPDELDPSRARHPSNTPRTALHVVPTVPPERDNHPDTDLEELAP